MQSFLSRTQLPGRYTAANLLGMLYARRGQEIEGRIGEYVYQFDLSDELQRQMYFGLYDRAEIALMSSVLGQGDTFLDVGANVGYYSLLASQLVGVQGQVHAFEPIPENAERLNSAIQRNSVQNIRVNQMAVGGSEGTLDLHIGDKQLGNSGWASVVASDRRPNVVTVRQVTIDQYLSEHGIDAVRLVKLDIEGAEPEAIAGMGSLLNSAHAPDILVELNPWLLDRRGLDSAAITVPLAAYGYRLFSSDTGVSKAIDASHPVTGLTNVYCRKRK